VPNTDISLQTGRFWATSIALFRERLLDFRSCWIVFIHIVWGRPGGLLQFSKEEKAVKIFLASVSSGIRAVWPNSKQGETPCLDNRQKARVAWLSVLPRHSAHGGTMWFLSAFADITDQSKIQIWKWVSTEWPSIHACVNSPFQQPVHARSERV